MKLPLALAFCMASTLVSCTTMQRLGGAIGLENTQKTRATVIQASPPIHQQYHGTGGADAGRQVNNAYGATEFYTQTLTVRCISTGQEAKGDIRLHRLDDAFYPGDTGTAAIGKTSGKLRHFTP